LQGDEVTLSDWTGDAKIAAYLRKQHPGLSLIKAAEAEAYGSFMGKLQAIARKNGKKIIHWEDVFDWAGPIESCGGVTPTLSNDTIVQVFRGGFGPGPKPCKDQLLGGCVCGSCVHQQPATACGLWVYVSDGLLVIEATAPRQRRRL